MDTNINQNTLSPWIFRLGVFSEGKGEGEGKGEVDGECETEAEFDGSRMHYYVAVVECSAVQL